MSSRPFSRLICAKSLSRSSRFEESALTAVTWPLISFAAESSSACLRPVTKTYAPSLTKRCAVARPIPAVPPVTSAVFPSSLPDIRFPSWSCCQSVPQSTQLGEALAQFRNEQLRLLESSEVTALRNLVPIEEFRIGLLAPHLRRCEKVAFEDADCNRQIEGHSREILSETLVIEPRRRRSSIGQPIERDVIQHVIERDGICGITLIVAPRLKLLVDPHCLPNRRIGQTVPQCLRTRRLDGAISRSIARILAELSQRRLFCGRIAAGWRWWWWKENRKIQMNGSKTRRPLLGHPARYASAPITALRNIVAVTQARHQRCPGASNPRKTPPRFCRFVRKAKAGEGGDYGVKGFIGFATVGRRVHQRTNDLHKLDDRPRPSMRQNDRQGILVLRSNVNEVNPETVNLR